MATRYTQEAAAQLNPAYDQQVAAVQSQIPAVQKLYAALLQGLQGQQQAGNQQILEDASGRGMLRSTMPVDAQAGLGAQILQKQGEYGAQQAKEIGGIYSQIGGIRTAQAGAIAQLGNSLFSNDLQQQQIANQVAQSNREFALSQQTADQQYQLALKGGF
jgi:hypothetical protein